MSHIRSSYRLANEGDDGGIDDNDGDDNGDDENGDVRIPLSCFKDLSRVTPMFTIFGSVNITNGTCYMYCISSSSSEFHVYTTTLLSLNSSHTLTTTTTPHHTALHTDFDLA